MDQSEASIPDRGNTESYRETEVQKADRRISPVARWTYAGEFNNLGNILWVGLHPHLKGYNKPQCHISQRYILPIFSLIMKNIQTFQICSNGLKWKLKKNLKGRTNKTWYLVKKCSCICSCCEKGKSKIIS